MTVLAWIWSGVAAACGMLALIHVFLWLNRVGGRRWSDLLPALAAAAAATMAFIEYRLLAASSVAEYGAWLTWANLSIALVLVPLVWSLRVHMGVGRWWLVWAITGLWSVALAINFNMPGSLVFTEIHELRRFTTPWGESFVLASGDVNPWTHLGNLASIAFIVFSADASIQALRQGKRESATLIGASMAAFILIAGVHTPLVDAGIIETPYMISFAFLLIVMAQTYSFARSAVQAADLARQVELRERRWETFIDSVHLAAIEFDTTGTIQFVNPHFTRITGFSTEELVGVPIEHLVDADSKPEFRRRLGVAVQSGPRPVSQWSIVGKNGEASVLLWSTVPLRDMDGGIIGFLAAGSDVTDQVEARRNLRDAQRERDRMVRAGMIGELTSTLAHELNQPLAAILSNAQAGRHLLGGAPSDPDELGAILDDIVHDGKRAGDVIHGLRAMLRNGETESGTLDLGEAIAEVHRLVRGDFQASGIVLDIVHASWLPPIQGSKVQVEQVLLNLLLNALHSVQTSSSSMRGVELVVRAEGGRVEVIVSDTGSGVPEGKLSTVFEPFYTTRESGLGMGLALSRRIVEAHGGRISARNRESGGAEFTFWLPASLSAEKAHGS